MQISLLHAVTVRHLLPFSKKKKKSVYEKRRSWRGIVFHSSTIKGGRGKKRRREREDREHMAAAHGRQLQQLKAAQPELSPFGQMSKRTTARLVELRMGWGVCTSSDSKQDSTRVDKSEKKQRKKLAFKEFHNMQYSILISYYIEIKRHEHFNIYIHLCYKFGNSLL